MSPSAFFSSANNTDGTQTELTFDTKYYGPCPQISATAESPVIDNILELMAARKAEGVVVRANLTFTEQGAVVTRRKSWAPVIGWHASNMVSCATTAHPTSKYRRIGLLKIRDPATGTLMWHLFKYYTSNKADNMTECFRFVVDCGLREIGRAYAAQLAQRQQQQGTQDWDGPPSEPMPVPPTYDDALTETNDFSRASTGSNVLYEDHENDFGYLTVTPCPC